MEGFARVWASESAIFALRHRFPAQADLHILPTEKIVLPLKSRDELPPILAGLQWIGTHPTLQAELFVLREAKLLAGKKATPAARDVAFLRTGCTRATRDKYGSSEKFVPGMPFRVISTT